MVEASSLPGGGGFGREVGAWCDIVVGVYEFGRRGVWPIWKKNPGSGLLAASRSGWCCCAGKMVIEKKLVVE